jgi:hypothetical protein
MPGIVNRRAATKPAAMLADDHTVLADHDAVGIGLDLDRPADGARGDRVLVVVEPHQAGLRDRCLCRVEPVKWAGNRHQLRALRLKGLPQWAQYYQSLENLPAEENEEEEFLCARA